MTQSFKTRWTRAILDPQNGLPSSAVTVALILAVYADRNGNCWPAVSTIAVEARRNRKTVHAALNHLEVLGYLMRDPGRTGKSNRYTITLPSSV